LKDLSTIPHKICFLPFIVAPLAAALLPACAGAQTKQAASTSAEAPVATTVGEEAPLEDLAPEPGPDSDEIVQVIRTQDSQMRQCYMLGSFKNSEFSGTVKVAFTIATTGRVSEVSNAGSDIADHEVVECVMDVFAQMEFRAGGMSPTEVTYPVNFGRPG
jgi:hypothetical protein